MLKLEYDKKEIEGVIDKIVKKTMNMDLTWDWPCGVAYYGISDAYEKTGKKEYLDLLKDRIDELIDLGLPKVWTVNACAMGHCLITLYQATGEQQGHIDASGDAVHLKQLYQTILHADSGHTYDTKALYRHAAGILCNDFIINDNISHMGIHRRTFHIEPPSYSDHLFLPICLPKNLQFRHI